MSENVLGVDMDSKGFQCVLIDPGTNKSVKRKYLNMERTLMSFLSWIKNNDSPIICIEGKNGYSLPLESFLHENKYPFYSISSKQVKKFRESFVSENKDNEKDAEAVARLGLALYQQNQLDAYRAIADDKTLIEIRQFSRIEQKETERRTESVNVLWHSIHYASSELYLFLKGFNPDSNNENNIIQNKGILNLLADRPDLTEWKNLSYEDIFNSMGGQKYKGRDALAKSLMEIAPNIKSISPSIKTAIRLYANQIKAQDKVISELEKEQERLSEGDTIIEDMIKYKGIGCKTASAIRGEIMNPLRFKNDDHLASYAGFGMKKVATGNTVKMVPNSSYNRRLKNAFMTAAKNLIAHGQRDGGDKHLCAYFRDLKKNQKLNPTEAYKRVARSWLRITQRRWKVAIKRRESEMA